MRLIKENDWIIIINDGAIWVIYFSYIHVRMYV